MTYFSTLPVVESRRRETRMSRIITIINGHFKSWYRSKSNIFWTIAFPLLLIVLFGAIFGSGSTKFDLYVQNQDLSGNTPTYLSGQYVSALSNTTAFNLHMVAAEQTNPLSYVKDDAQLHNRGQRLLVIPLGFQTVLNTTQQARMDTWNGRLPDDTGYNITRCHPLLRVCHLRRHRDHRHLHGRIGRCRSPPFPWDRNGTRKLRKGSGER